MRRGKEGDKTIKEEMWVMNIRDMRQKHIGKCLHIHSHIDTSAADYYIGQWN